MLFLNLYIPYIFISVRMAIIISANFHIIVGLVSELYIITINTIYFKKLIFDFENKNLVFTSP